MSVMIFMMRFAFLYIIIVSQDKVLLDITKCTIDEAFNRVSSELLRLLDNDKISIKTVNSICFKNANTDSGVGYPEDLQSKMNAATSISELFQVLALYPTHWSWMNTQLMGKIASVSD